MSPSVPHARTDASEAGYAPAVSTAGDKAVSVATQFAAALNRRDWAGVRALLTADCAYECRGSTTVGADAIVSSYRTMDTWVSETFESVRYDSDIEARPRGQVLIEFRDRMDYGEHHLDFRCLQLLSFTDDNASIRHIEHIDLPGERDKADRFNRACGVTRPS